MNKLKADILAGYLTLLSKKTYLGVISRGDVCIQVHPSTGTKPGNIAPSQDMVEVLKARIEVLKEHIEHAEQFIAELKA